MKFGNKSCFSFHFEEILLLLGHGNGKGDETRFFPSFIIKEKKEKDGAEGS